MDIVLCKKIITGILIIGVSGFLHTAFGQEKKPTIMILPSDNWCNTRFFTTSFEDQDRTIKVPDYQRAFLEDCEIGPVVSHIGQMLTNLGYSLKDSEQELKNLSIRSVEDENTISKDGSFLAESQLDVLKRCSKADIIIQIGWQLNNESNGRSLSFTMEAFDSYTSKRIATSTGISRVTSEVVPRILSSAIEKQVKPFDEQLTKYFSSLIKYGREIKITIRRWDSWEYDLETEFCGEELLEIIQEWLSNNTVEGNYNLSDATENCAYFEQVRIPLRNDKGVAMDARSFASGLRKFLKTPEYNISSKIMTRGLGEVIIVLGE